MAILSRPLWPLVDLYSFIKKCTDTLSQTLGKHHKYIWAKEGERGREREKERAREREREWRRIVLQAILTSRCPSSVLWNCIQLSLKGTWTDRGQQASSILYHVTPSLTLLLSLSNSVVLLPLLVSLSLSLTSLSPGTQMHIHVLSDRKLNHYCFNLYPL